MNKEYGILINEEFYTGRDGLVRKYKTRERAIKEATKLKQRCYSKADIRVGELVLWESVEVTL